MMQRRRYKAVAVLLALAVVAAACGDDDDDDAASTDEGSDTTAAAAAEGPPAVTLDDECEAAQDDGVTAPEGFRVNLVTDIGRVDDGTFNQFAYEAMDRGRRVLRLRDELHRDGVRGRLRHEHRDLARGRPRRADHQRVPDRRPTRSPRPRPTPTSTSSGSTSSRSEYPDNYIGVLFREDQGGYLAGVLAASLSESGVIGVVGGREDVPPVVRFVNAYETGAESVNPDIRVLSVYNESFTAPDKGASDAAAVHR